MARLLAYLIPGWLLGVAVLAIGWLITPPPARHAVPALANAWSEPKQPEGVFKSFRLDETGAILGETEPWPHLHRRANSFLVSRRSFAGDVELSVDIEFLHGRYLGAHLCHDPVTGDGYWLGTGHHVGEDPNRAYIKIVRGGAWEEVASAPLAIARGQRYHIAFARRGDELTLTVDGGVIVRHRDASFKAGQVQLRLHNTRVRIFSISVNGAEDLHAPSGDRS